MFIIEFTKLRVFLNKSRFLMKIKIICIQSSDPIINLNVYNTTSLLNLVTVLKILNVRLLYVKIRYSTLIDVVHSSCWHLLFFGKV